ncbi:MAG: histidine triad nucleotide-binding protein [bacterium]|nr:histidine triad nucleotide-binding protein [bacterium]
MNDCLFCKIAAGEIPCNEVFSTDNLIAFHDISPQAPTHILIIPRRHISGLDEISNNDQELMGELLTCAKTIATKEGLQDNGYRFVINQGSDGGQTVGHLHLHILGGRALAWPPG